MSEKVKIGRKRKLPILFTTTVVSGGRKRNKGVRIPSRALPADCKSVQTNDLLINTNDEEMVLEMPEGVSRYRANKRKLVEAWDSVRDHMLKIYTETVFRPASYICVLCGIHEDNIIWCQDCSHRAYFCSDCNIKHHKITQFHAPMSWSKEIGMYLYIQPEESIQGVGHICTSHQKTGTIVVVDLTGRHHHKEFVFCECESAAVTLVRYGLWPSTPTSPKVAFTIPTMEMLRVLLMQCQVPVSGFGTVLDLLGENSSLPFKLVSQVNKSLSRDSFEEYRYFSYRQRYLQTVDGRCDDGTQCPACPQDCDNAVSMYSIDGNFGLVRKTSAGESDVPPKHVKKFFIDQVCVDTYIKDYSEECSPTDCSDFHAGNMIRAKGRTAKLDEKGLFGSVCRHEYPKLFLNLKHGERLGYAVKLLEEILEQKQQPSNIFYDIACVLETHLKKRNNTDLLRKMNLAIPIFHSYGHKTGCQVLYNPRKLGTFGLTDGESTERLWSYLRRFSRITKEMTASHRQDVLVDALMFYGERLRSSFGKGLSSKLQKAQDTQALYDSELRQLASLVPGGVTSEQAEQWHENARQFYLNSHRTRLGTESKHSRMLVDIQKLCHERTYLLSLKKKYADGQTIAMRLTKQLTKTMKCLRKRICDYNNLEQDVSGKYPKKIQEDTVFNHGNTLWALISDETSVLGDGLQQLKADVVNAHLYKLRATEEIILLKDEMRRVKYFYVLEHEKAFEEAQRYKNQGDEAQASMWLNKCMRLELRLQTLAHQLNDNSGHPSILIDAIETVIERSKLNIVDCEDVLENDEEESSDNSGDEDC